MVKHRLRLWGQKTIDWFTSLVVGKKKSEKHDEKLLISQTHLEKIQVARQAVFFFEIIIWVTRTSVGASGVRWRKDYF